MAGFGAPMGGWFYAPTDTVRPRENDVSLELLWALLNSPVANAFAYTHLLKRHNLVRELKRLPIPKNWTDNGDIVRGVTAYFGLFNRASHPDKVAAKSAFLRVEESVLRLYDFPSNLERQLLNEFSGYPRLGVPFAFDGYGPPNFKEDVSLSNYLKITEDWPQVNKRRETLIRKKVNKTISQEEKHELQGLQQLATYRQRLVDPLPLAELERVSSRLAR